jgi:hypothetical protein
MAGPDYAMFSLPGQEAPLGGMGGMMGAVEGVPSHWLRTSRWPTPTPLWRPPSRPGGRVVVPPFDTEFGRMGGVMDPTAPCSGSPSAGGRRSGLVAAA